MKTSSLALWYIPRDPAAEGNPKDVEVHFNLWKMPAGSFWFRSKRLFLRYLDIGIRLNNAKQIKSIKFYVPTVLRQGDIKDLGGFLKETDLLCAVFNENLRIASQGTSDYYEVFRGGPDPEFIIYKLDESSFELDHTTEQGATIVTINLNYTKIPDLYIRFRIKGNYADTLSYIDNPPNSIFQSAFYKSDTIDFRANEIRVLKNKLVEKMKEGRILLFNKLHFFFICSSQEEWYFSQMAYTNCRILENEKWKVYSEDITLPSWNKTINWIHNKTSKEKDSLPPVLAYHWKPPIKDGKSLPDFNILIKTKFEQNDIWTIFGYLLFAFGFGLLTNYVSGKIEGTPRPAPQEHAPPKPAVNNNDTSGKKNSITFNNRLPNERSHP